MEPDEDPRHDAPDPIYEMLISRQECLVKAHHQWGNHKEVTDADGDTLESAKCVGCGLVRSRWRWRWPDYPEFGDYDYELSDDDYCDAKDALTPWEPPR